MLLGDNDYCGMASWTGTMFEYFMPHLLLPAEPNSFLYETLAFCVYAQKRRGAKMRTPWGISESAFYAFDPARNYQYKAHGVQSLGLKRGLDQELVLHVFVQGVVNGHQAHAQMMGHIASDQGKTLLRSGPELPV